jgi:hypothetical protein
LTAVFSRILSFALPSEQVLLFFLLLLVKAHYQPLLNHLRHPKLALVAVTTSLCIFDPALKAAGTH